MVSKWSGEEIRSLVVPIAREISMASNIPETITATQEDDKIKANTRVDDYESSVKQIKEDLDWMKVNLRKM